MMIKKMPRKTSDKEKTADEGAKEYVFRLFVTGFLPNSARAIVNIGEICDKYLKGRFELEIIDIYQQPSLALEENIIALPVLIKKLPLPEKRLTGDLSDIEQVLKGLLLS